MNSLSGKLGVILVIGFIFGYAEVWGVDWIYLGETRDGEYFYDADRVIRASRHIVRVWQKKYWSKEGVIDYVANMGEKYKDLRYSIAFYEINCTARKYQFLHVAFFSNEDKVISKVGLRNKWEFIVPDSMDELLMEVVCK